MACRTFSFGYMPDAVLGTGDIATDKPDLHRVGELAKQAHVKSVRFSLYVLMQGMKTGQRNWEGFSKEVMVQVKL